MEIGELLQTLAEKRDCLVLPGAGVPFVEDGHTLPEDLQEFYFLCGGLTLKGAGAEVTIVSPQRFVPSNPIMLPEMDSIDWADDASRNWYILAEDEHAEYLLIDLGERHNGRCYDGFHETYGLVGDMRVIASSFTDLLCRLLKNPGSRHYWLTPRFEALGDAYD